MLELGCEVRDWKHQGDKRLGYNKEDQILEWRLGGEERLEVIRRSENRVNVMCERMEATR
jgi:hypothetical protein